MANRFFNPNEQFCDATGLPYAGGSLTFYASGTTTPLNTYSDKALSIANTNPVVLDSAGRAGSIFLQNLAYKVVLSDVNSNVIWTFDPVYASDFSTVAQFQSGNGSPNGSVAGTAGSSTIPASSYWDATNNILYICTQTGTTSTAAWTAINSATAAAVVPAPQGYLTTVSGTPIITSDSIGVSTVFYTPYLGNIIPIYNGTSFVPTIFSEISIALVANHAANTIYDLFVFNNSGVLTLVTGPAWSNSSAGAGSRGSGAGTTQLSRVSGSLVNTVQMSARNGSTTYTVPANQGTYVGSIFMDSVAGQVTCHRTYGQNRKFGLWNYYNRVPIILKAGDPTASWNSAPTTWRQSRNDAGNRISVFTGFGEECSEFTFRQSIAVTTNNSISASNIGIGLNSTTSPSGRNGFVQLTNNTASSITNLNDAVAAFFVGAGFIGLNNINSLEQATSGTTNNLFNGTETNMVLSAIWRG